MPITLNGTTGEVPASWTTATRPASPTAGQTGYNTTTLQMETYNGSAWVIGTSATTQGTSSQYLKSAGAGAAPTWSALTLPTGSILQVVSTTKTDTFSSATTAGTYVDITGLSVSITPSSATSKIFVVFAIGATGTNTSQDIMFRLVRNSTNIAIADSGPTYTTTVAVRSLNAELTSTPTMFYLDSPATTSATTYKITGSTSGGGTLVVNKRQSDTSFGAVSTITVMEVAA